MSSEFIIFVSFLSFLIFFRGSTCFCGLFSSFLCLIIFFYVFFNSSLHREPGMLSSFPHHASIEANSRNLLRHLIKLVRVELAPLGLHYDMRMVRDVDRQRIPKNAVFSARPARQSHPRTNPGIVSRERVISSQLRYAMGARISGVGRTADHRWGIQELMGLHHRLGLVSLRLMGSMLARPCRPTDQPFAEVVDEFSWPQILPIITEGEWEPWTLKINRALL